MIDLTAIFSGGTGVATPQTDTSTASFAGNYAFGAQDFNGISEHPRAGSRHNRSTRGDRAHHRSVRFLCRSSSKLHGCSLHSHNHARPNQRRTLSTPALEMTPVSGSPADFQVAIYQASGGQLYWIDEDTDSLFLGSVQSLSLSRSHAASKTSTKRIVSHKR